MEDCEIDRFRCGDYSFPQSDVEMTRSRPDTRLSELEEQLEVAETRCGSLKSQLDYMKMLYQGVHPYSTDLTETTEELPQTEPQKTAQSSPRDTVKQTAIPEDDEDCGEKKTESAEDVKYYEFLKEIHKMQEITRELEHADLRGASPKKPGKSPTFTPRLVEEQEGISADCRRTKQVRKTYTLLEASDEGAPMLMPVTAAVTSLQIPEAGNEDDADDETTSHHPYQHSLNYSARMQADLATARLLTSRFMSDNNPERGGYDPDEDKKERRKQELVLKLTESMASTRVTVKRKKITKVDKKQKTTTCAGPVSKKIVNSKWEDTLSVASNNKTKKKKGKLRTASSRNTVMTKQTNLTDRRDSKKRKQKGFSSATHMTHRFQVPIQRAPITKAEVVEIYHNNAVEGGSGSISMSSSKHSKETTQPKSNNPVAKKAHQAQTSSAVAYQHQLSRSCDERKDSRDDGGCELARVAFEQNNDEDYQKYSSRSRKSQNHETKDAEAEAAHCDSAPHPSRYYDPTITRNYELPTVASELKKVNRSYYNRFNFRNIPFVVSTSVTPSHNLGLNIQQVLSIMKTRQPMGTGMTPLLIRKMSKGMRPVGALMDCINESSLSPKSPKSTILGRQSDYVPSVRPQTTADCASTLIDETAKPSRQAGSSTTKNRRLDHSDSGEMKQRDSSLEEAKDVPSDEKLAEQQESGYICCPKRSKSYDRILKQYASRKSITGNPTLTSSALLRERQEEINIGDNQYNKTENASGNGKSIREVLINLHDQFEELNTAYEMLQEQAAKSNDKSIKKQIAALEQELNAKEEEINAFVGLYKEVLQLKNQMNSVHGNNSFVCISTGNHPSSPGMGRHSGHMRTNPMQIYNVRDKALSSTTREPATATRLTGLLREIQSFQKQLLAL